MRHFEGDQASRGETAKKIRSSWMVPSKLCDEIRRERLDAAQRRVPTVLTRRLQRQERLLDSEPASETNQRGHILRGSGHDKDRRPSAVQLQRDYHRPVF